MKPSHLPAQNRKLRFDVDMIAWFIAGASLAYSAMTNQNWFFYLIKAAIVFAVVTQAMFVIINYTNNTRKNHDRNTPQH